MINQLYNKNFTFKPLKAVELPYYPELEPLKNIIRESQKRKIELVKVKVRRNLLFLNIKNTT